MTTDERLKIPSARMFIPGWVKLTTPEWEALAPVWPARNHEESVHTSGHWIFSPNGKTEPQTFIRLMIYLAEMELGTKITSPTKPLVQTLEEVVKSGAAIRVLTMTDEELEAELAAFSLVDDR